MSNHILILNRWPQYSVGERWDNALARYSDLIDHHRYRVTYLCDPLGAQGMSREKGGAFAGDVPNVHVVPDLSDTDAVLAQGGRLIDRTGPFDHVIAFSEYLLDVAALIRDCFDIPGDRPADTDRFRDKTIMKTILAAAGVRVPVWSACPGTGEESRADAGALPDFPLILKPRRGASSKDVHKVSSRAALEELLVGRNTAEFEIEEFIDGTLCHADGVLDRSARCLFMNVARSLAPCLAFA
ncbi:MAG: carboxylate--amine ligase, partial [Methanobacterium sp.]|nr:carboxylate--amine ligase [Methanobacterium sp.]